MEGADAVLSAAFVGLPTATVVTAVDCRDDFVSAVWRLSVADAAAIFPSCFLSVSAVRRWFYQWRDSGLWLSLNHALLLIGREATGREASPGAGAIDS